MTFQANPTMPGNPTIRIFFHGLIILHSPDGRSCLAEIHRVPGYGHTLSVEIRTKIPGKPDQVVMRHFGNLAGAQPGLSVRVEPTSTTPAAYKYLPSSSFNPINLTGNEQDDDFRWIINLESSIFHGTGLSVDYSKTQPGVVIEGGVCYVYTALVRKGQVLVTQGGASRPPLQGLSAIVGANLYLDSGSGAVVTCHHSNDEDFVLRLEALGGGVSHEIYIENSPLFEDPTSGSTHSELREYYKVIPGILPEEQFNLEFPTPPQSVEQRKVDDPPPQVDLMASFRVPCQSITLDG